MQFECALKRYAKYVTSFSIKRKQEFLTGRILAERLLAQYGLSHFTIGISDFGAPDWPNFLVGSISHDFGFFTVAALLKVQYQYLGIDIHRYLTLFQLRRIKSRFVKSDAFHFNECADDFSLSETIFLNMLFSAKEAAYKSLPAYLQSTSLTSLSLVKFERISETHYLFTFNRDEQVSRQVLVVKLQNYVFSMCSLDIGSLDKCKFFLSNY